MKDIRRDPLFEKIEQALLKAYHHIPAEIEAEKKRKKAAAAVAPAQK